MRKLWALLLVLLILVHGASTSLGSPSTASSSNTGPSFGSVVLGPDSYTIGTSVSAFTLTSAAERTMFEFSGSPGVMTYLWITGGYDGFQDLRVRYYIDGELHIEFDNFLGAGIGFGDQQAWGTALMGKGANTGSVYNTYQIPFSKSVKITLQLPPHTSPPQGGNYFVCRGITNATVSIGRYLLPPQAKLRLYKNELVSVQPLQFLDIYRSRPGLRGGAILQVTFVGVSGNYNFLEGCFRAYIPPTATKMTYLLSSGTEDYFQSGWYFNAGKFYFEGAGCTHLDNSNTVAAYKVHTDDPLFFNAKGFRMAWRNGDTGDPATGQKCINDNSTLIVGNPTTSYLTTYAWVYEW
jgi:hypothetical protein